MHTKLLSQDQVNVKELNEIYNNLEKHGIEELENEGVPHENRLLIRTCDIRYFGQAYELSVPIPSGVLAEKDIYNIAERFHKMHEQTYGHAMKDDPIEFVNYRVSAVGQLKKPNLGQDRKWKTGINSFDKKVGKAIFDGKEYNVPIFDRNSLGIGLTIEGPAIIGEMGQRLLFIQDRKQLLIT